MEDFKYSISFYEITNKNMTGTAKDIVRSFKRGEYKLLWSNDEIIVPSRGDIIRFTDEGWESFYEVILVMFEQGHRYNSSIWEDNSRSEKCVDAVNVYVKKI